MWAQALVDRAACIGIVKCVRASAVLTSRAANLCSISAATALESRSFVVTLMSVANRPDDLPRSSAARSRLLSVTSVPSSHDLSLLRTLSLSVSAEATTARSLALISASTLDLISNLSHQPACQCVNRLPQSYPALGRMLPCTHQLESCLAPHIERSEPALV
jgi:hypothetical protein